jgi:hypothetical protein
MSQRSLERRYAELRFIAEPMADEAARSLDGTVAAAVEYLPKPTP